MLLLQSLSVVWLFDNAASEASSRSSSAVVVPFFDKDFDAPDATNGTTAAAAVSSLPGTSANELAGGFIAVIHCGSE